jgi:hypothetical protein
MTQLVIRMPRDDSETSPPLATKSGVAYAETSSAPFVYFDGVSCHGAMHGVIEIELAARIMAPTADGGVDMKFTPTARLRCSVAAAAALRLSIDAATQMVEQPQQPPAAASKLN